MVAQKGKQATKGQKQIVAENQSTLEFYRNMALVANGVYLVGAYCFYDLFSFKQLSLILLSTIAYVGSYQFMVHMAKSKRSDSGQLLDSGLDLNLEGGIGEQVKDVIILTAICQVLSIISMYFWFLWLLAPARVLWLLWRHILEPYFLQKAPEAPEINEKKQKKLERRMKRQQNR